jgi:hypothetical protein
MIDALLASSLFNRLFPIAMGLLIAFGLSVALYLVGYKAGAASIQKSFDAFKLQIAERDAENERHALKDLAFRTRKAEVIVEEHIVYVDRVRTVTKTLTKEVPVYVPADACPLPDGFRLLHDAAAEGRDPEPPGSPNAAPVPAQDAAATIVENYGTCHEDQRRLADLQKWVREVAAEEVRP